MMLPIKVYQFIQIYDKFPYLLNYEKKNTKDGSLNSFDNKIEYLYLYLSNIISFFFTNNFVITFASNGRK
jgi:hypothetical protein